MVNSLPRYIDQIIISCIPGGRLREGEDGLKKRYAYFFMQVLITAMVKSNKSYKKR